MIERTRGSLLLAPAAASSPAEARAFGSAVRHSATRRSRLAVAVGAERKPPAGDHRRPQSSGTAPSARNRRLQRGTRSWSDAAAPARRRAASESSIGDSRAIVAPPISTANSGVSANRTAALSQPTNRPRVPWNRPQTMKIGPSASSIASAIRARAAPRPCRASSSKRRQPQQVRAGRDRARVGHAAPWRPRSAAAACATTAKIVSRRSANSCVAVPWVPVSRLAIWSGAPTAGSRSPTGRRPSESRKSAPGPASSSAASALRHRQRLRPVISAEREEGDVEREHDGQRRPSSASEPNSRAEGELRRLAAQQSTTRSASAMPDGPPSPNVWQAAHSAASSAMMSPSASSPGQREPVSAGYQCGGLVADARASRRAGAPSLSRPDRIVSTSGMPDRSSRTTTLCVGLADQEARLCAGKQRISSSSCAVRPKPVAIILRLRARRWA